MALNIDDSEVDRLARELADLTGEKIGDAVAQALRERIEKAKEIKRVRQAVKEISDHVAALPVLDSRSADEILGYDEHGLPT